jgi:hypothetical protein
MDHDCAGGAAYFMRPFTVWNSKFISK